MKKALVALSLTFLFASQIVQAQWDVISETNDVGTKLEIAEKVGDGGFVLSFVCSDMGTHVEVWILDKEAEENPGAAFLFSVDGRQPVRIGGYMERVDQDMIIFTGRDIRDRPAAQTKKLMKQVKLGNNLSLAFFDPDLKDFLSIEEWSLSGSSTAVSEMEDKCTKLQAQ